MDNLIGKAVKWKHVNKVTNVPIVDVRGWIAGLAGLNTTGSFKLLIQNEEGVLWLFDYSDLVVGPDFDVAVANGGFYEGKPPVSSEAHELETIQEAMDAIGFPMGSDVFEDLVPKDGSGLVVTAGMRASFLLKTLFDELQELSLSAEVLKEKLETSASKEEDAPKKRGRPPKVKSDET